MECTSKFILGVLTGKIVGKHSVPVPIRLLAISSNGKAEGEFDRIDCSPLAIATRIGLEAILIARR